jgi:hypothetical protein
MAVTKLERIDRTINALTGEVLEQRQKIIDLKPMEQEPDYVKLYIEDIGRMMGLQDGHRSILLYVAASVSYDGMLSMTSYRKSRIASTLGCSKRSIDNAISEFVRQGILIRVARGEYELDPHLFAKGRWVDIRQRRLEFTAKITYNPKGGRTIETEVSG